MLPWVLSQMPERQVSHFIQKSESGMGDNNFNLGLGRTVYNTPLGQSQNSYSCLISLIKRTLIKRDFSSENGWQRGIVSACFPAHPSSVMNPCGLKISTVICYGILW